MIGFDNNEGQNGKMESTSPFISPEEGKELLHNARLAIKEYLIHGKLPDDVKQQNDDSVGCGIFVTLWRELSFVRSAEYSSEESVLRGCIGHLQSNIPLDDLVKVVAVAAATRDPRFPPLSVDELNTTRIEIAILSPFRQISKLQQINLGQDGLMIEGLGKRGLLLPKVAVRMGWDRSTFLDNVCRKAGLPPDCWPAICNLYAFTTTVLDESDYPQS